jgi:predicted PurR-regulated permease PerM
MPSNSSEPAASVEVSSPARHGTMRRAMLIVVVGLSALTVWSLRTLLPAVLLGAWVAAVTEPFSVRLARRLGGRTRAASILTLSLVVFLLGIVAVFLVPVITDVLTAMRALRHMVPDGRTLSELPERLAELPAQSDHASHPSVALVKELAPLASEAVGLAASAIMQLVVFLVTAYYLAIDGRRLQAGVERVSPLGAENTRAFIDEFVAVGRGIAVAMGLAALATATLLGVAYAAVGVPRALLLAAITFVTAMLPIGASLVWIPVSVLLLAHGRDGAAFVVASVGLVGVSGFVDHALRPWLVRFGRLTLHPLLTLIGLFGGVVTFGPWGVFLGPLLVAMTATAVRQYAPRPILARRSIVPGERVTVVSIIPPAVAPAPIEPDVSVVSAMQ